MSDERVERKAKRIEPGDMIRVTSGIGAGQVVKVQSLERLPMGTGVNVVLDGGYPETLNPANVEVVPHPLEAENARLRGQVKYLRDYAIYTRAALYKFEHGTHPTEEQYQAITGAIDSNMAVAADRAVQHAKEQG